eukprot:823028-Amphidinium_carterae.1
MHGSSPTAMHHWGGYTAFCFVMLTHSSTEPSAEFCNRTVQRSVAKPQELTIRTPRNTPKNRTTNKMGTDQSTRKRGHIAQQYTLLLICILCPTDAQVLMDSSVFKEPAHPPQVWPRSQ